MDITIVDSKINDLEIVECKGKGHPDTLADRLAERLSCAYSLYTKKNYGAVLHHNFDKVGMMGGKCEVSFGHGSLIEPIRVLLNGRASGFFGKEDIHVETLLVKEAQKFFLETFPMLDSNSDLRILYEVSTGSSPGGVSGHNSMRHKWFSPDSLDDLSELKFLACNDTSLGWGYYMKSDLESLILQIETVISSKLFKEKNKWIGSDIKILGIRNKNKYSITLAVPQLCSYVCSLDEYIANKDIVIKEIKNIFDLMNLNGTLEVFLNMRDKIINENVDLYLTLTGSSIEMGDEGFVGRGNRVGGLITPLRSYTMEGICGKNPIYHTGKLYCIASYEISKMLYLDYNINAEIMLIGQTGQNLKQPWKVCVKSYDSKIISNQIINEVIKKVFNNIDLISSNIIDSKYRMC